jgi:hypothetical protein
MKVCHLFAGLALVASIVLAILGFFKAAAAFVVLSTAVELVASAVNDKQTNR